MYLRKTELKERGWTEVLIRNFLGRPDEERPHFLYSRARVQQVEGSSAFAEALALANKRLEAGATRLRLRRERLLQYVDELVIDVTLVQRHPICYAEKLDRVAGNLGAGEAHWRLKKKIVEAIGKADPLKANSCSRRLELLEQQEKKSRCRRRRRKEMHRPDTFLGFFTQLGFTLEVAYYGEGPVDVSFEGSGGEAWESVNDRDFTALAKGCSDTKEVGPLLDWMIEHNIGDKLFQEVLHRCASGEAARILQENSAEVWKQRNPRPVKP